MVSGIVAKPRLKLLQVVKWNLARLIGFFFFSEKSQDFFWVITSCESWRRFCCATEVPASAPA